MRFHCGISSQDLASPVFDLFDQFCPVPPVLTNSLSCYVCFADWTLFAGLVTYCAPIHSTLLHSSNLSLQLVRMLQSNKLVLIERERHEELNTGKGGAVYTGVAKSL